MRRTYHVEIPANPVQAILPVIIVRGAAEEQLAATESELGVVTVR